MPRRPTGTAMVPMHLKVPPALRSWYEQEAARRTLETGQRVNYAQLVREALEAYRRRRR